MFIEGDVIPRAICVTDLGIFEHDRMYFTGADRMEQTVAGGMPITGLIKRWNGHDVGHLRKLLVFLNELRDIVELRLVEIFTALGLADRFDCRGHAGFKGFQLGREVLRAFELNAVFQSLI